MVAELEFSTSTIRRTLPIIYRALIVISEEMTEHLSSEFIDHLKGFYNTH